MFRYKKTSIALFFIFAFMFGSINYQGDSELVNPAFHFGQIIGMTVFSLLIAFISEIFSKKYFHHVLWITAIFFAYIIYEANLSGKPPFNAEGRDIKNNCNLAFQRKGADMTKASELCTLFADHFAECRKNNNSYTYCEQSLLNEAPTIEKKI